MSEPEPETKTDATNDSAGTLADKLPENVNVTEALPGVLQWAGAHSLSSVEMSFLISFLTSRLMAHGTAPVDIVRFATTIGRILRAQEALYDCQKAVDDEASQHQDGEMLALLNERLEAATHDAEVVDDECHDWLRHEREAGRLPYEPGCHALYLLRCVLEHGHHGHDCPIDVLIAYVASCVGLAGVKPTR